MKRILTRLGEKLKEARLNMEENQLKKEKVIISKAVRLKSVKPYYVVRFKTGGHVTEKDRPRDKNWRKWDCL